MKNRFILGFLLFLSVTAFSQSKMNVDKIFTIEELSLAKLQVNSPKEKVALYSKLFKLQAANHLKSIESLKKLSVEELVKIVEVAYHIKEEEYNRSRIEKLHDSSIEITLEYNDELADIFYGGFGVESAVNTELYSGKMNNDERLNNKNLVTLISMEPNTTGSHEILFDISNGIAKEVSFKPSTKDWLPIEQKLDEYFEINNVSETYIDFNFAESIVSFNDHYEVTYPLITHLEFERYHLAGNLSYKLDKLFNIIPGSVILNHIDNNKIVRL